MDYKKTKADLTTVTRNMIEFESRTDNVYESIVIMAKRANQIGSTMKTELDSKLAEFASNTDNLEEIFENREQIEVSLWNYPHRITNTKLSELNHKIIHSKQKLKRSVTSSPVSNSH